MTSAPPPPPAVDPGALVRQEGVLLVGTPADREGLVLALRARGADVRTVDPADGEDAVRAALATHAARLPVACGGDGSVHHLVRELAEAGTLHRPVGVLPRGTGDDLAGHLALPRDEAAAADALLTGRVRRLDLLETDDGALVVNADHLGLGARAAGRADALKPFLGPLAYLVGGVAVGWHQSTWECVVEVDGEVVHEGPAVVVAVGVGHRVGGGVPLLPGSQADEGAARVVVAAPVGRRERVALGLALRRGEHPGRAGVTAARGQEVRLRADRPMPVDLDGELLAPVTERSWTLREAAWGVVVASG